MVHGSPVESDLEQKRGSGDPCKQRDRAHPAGGGGGGGQMGSLFVGVSKPPPFGGGGGLGREAGGPSG